jgi:hypothetical protein
MIKWEETMFGATDVEKLRARRITNKYFTGVYYHQ